MVNIEEPQTSTHFQPMFHFCAPLKTSENIGFSDISRGYRSGTLVENGLTTKVTLKNLLELKFVFFSYELNNAIKPANKICER